MDKSGRDLPDLRPVELDFFRFHLLHAPTQVVADTDRFRIRLQVMHGNRYREVWRQEEPETGARRRQ